MSWKPRRCVIAGLVTTGPGGGLFATAMTSYRLFTCMFRKAVAMLSQNQSRYLTTIGFALLALLFASDLLLKPPKELVLLAIDCISALYFTATLFVGLKERKKGAVAASAVGVIIAIASFFI